MRVRDKGGYVLNELKLRHETKHDIRYSEYLAIRSRLQAIAEYDRNAGEQGTYRIRSLYFDNYNDKALREKLDGVYMREKFRIRYYNDDLNVIHLEKKTKIGGLGNKQSQAITKEEVQRILNGDIEFLKDSKKALLVEFYSKMKYQLLKPRVVVEYVREPYIYKTGNVRITFDTNIKSDLYNRDFLNENIPGIEAGTQNGILMEVKYDAFLPEIIAQCIQVNERSGAAFSKYAACRRFG